MSTRPVAGDATHQVAVAAGDHAGGLRCIACGERFDPVAWYYELCEPCSRGLLEWALRGGGHYRADRSSMLRYRADRSEFLKYRADRSSFLKRAAAAARRLVGS